MKKSILLILVLTFAQNNISAQFNAPDSKGKSSILNQPSSAGVEMENGKLNLEFNNIGSMMPFKNKWLVGVKYRGGSENGVFQLFDSGGFVFGNEISGFFGYSFMPSSNEEKIWLNMLDKLDSTSTEEAINRMTLIRKAIVQFIDSNKTELSEKQITGIITNIFSVSDTLHPVSFSEIDLKTDDNSLESFYMAYDIPETLKNKIRNLFISVLKMAEEEVIYKESVSIIRKEYESKFISPQSKPAAKPRLTIFITGAISRHKFSLIDSLESGLPFIKETEFTGAKLGIGANIRLKGKHYIGLLYNIDWIDNFQDLNKKNCSFSERDTISGKIFEFKTDLSAYEGNYQTFQKHTIGVDFVNQISFPDMSRIAINLPYFRYNAITGLEKAKNTLDIGVAANFYKTSGNFLFSLYTEFADVTNSNKAENNAFTRFSVGLRVNYCLFTELGNND